MSKHPLPAVPLLLLLALWQAPGPAHAVSEVEMRLAAVAGPDWRAADVSLLISDNPDGSTLIRAAIGRLQLAPPLEAMEAVELTCPRARITASETRCADGTLSLRGGPLDKPSVRVSLTLVHATRALTLRLTGAAFAGGSLESDLDWKQAGWNAGLRGQKLKLGPALARLQGLVALPAGASADARIDLTLRAGGNSAGATRLSLQAHASDLAFSDATGLNAGAGLSLAAKAQGERRRQSWTFQGEVRVEAGEMVIDPLYLKLGEAPVTLSAEGSWTQESEALIIDRLGFRHPDILDVSASGALHLAASPMLERAEVGFAAPDLGRLYTTYLQPMQAGKTFGDLEVAGSATGTLELDRDGPSSASITLTEAHLDDRKGRFGLYGVNGDVHWARSRDPAPTRVRWQGGHVYRIDLGAAQFAGLARDKALRLTQPLEVAVLDGGLRIEALELGGMGTPDLSAVFEGSLTPLSMEALSKALGWPNMGGTLSGVIPQVRYANGRADIGGALLVKVFDGSVVVHKLALERPFGVVPKLSAEVDVTRLDLEALTRAFSFGRIQGRLSGKVRGLELQNWRPVAFDARLQTPDDDDSRHRISQRAVDNLASLGGAGGALSRTFLSFFEEFSYNRLGLACRLVNGLCHMDGVERKENGYYIVKGGGIPRIDVVGFERQVDWDSLLERLQNITSAGPPVIK